MSSENIYYVYSYADPITNEIFYIGMGKKLRAWQHIQECKRRLKNNNFSHIGNKHKTYKIFAILKNNLQPIVTIIKSQISKQDADLLEVQLIKEIGRHDMGKGPLTNLTDGGDGRIGWSDEQKLINGRRKSIELIGNDHYKFVSKEGRLRIAEASKINSSRSKWVNNNINEKFTIHHEKMIGLGWTYGRLPKPESAKQKLREYNKKQLQKGRPKSEQTKKRLSETAKKRPHCVKVAHAENMNIKMCCLCCKKEMNTGNYNRWHGEKCKYRD